jgi:alkylation response protein AidB-like acyl-CoA dehydrogenase
VAADRPHGILDGPLQVIVSIAMPIITAVYLGVAEAAYQAALEAVGDRRDDPVVQRQVGLMAHRLQVAGWALDGATAVVGDDPEPSMGRFGAVMAAKREVALAAEEVTGLALQVAGGRAFAQRSVIERCLRDARGAALHPLGPERTLLHAGRRALGLPVDEL